MSELQRLRDRVAELEDMLGIGPSVADTLRIKLGITGRQSKILGALLKREMLSRESAYFALYGDLPESEQPDSEKAVEKNLYFLRKRLEGRGIDIRNIWGKGWFLPPEHKAKLRSLLVEERAA